VSSYEFGLFGIVNSGVLFFLGVIDSLLFIQMVVRSPRRLTSERGAYFSRQLIILILLCLVLTTSIFACAFEVGQYYSAVRQYIPLLEISLSVSFSSVLKEFFVRYFYIESKVMRAVGVNFVVSITLFVSVFLFRKLSAQFGAYHALISYGLSNGLGALVGLYMSGFSIRPSNLKLLSSEFQESFIGGRWALLGVLISWCQAQAYVYVSALYAGPVAVAFLNKVRLVVMPYQLIMTAVSQALLPRIASIALSDVGRVIRYSAKISLWFVAGGIGYIFFAWSFQILANSFFIKISNFDSFGLFIFAWGLVLIFQSSRVGSVACLQVLGDFRGVAVLNFLPLCISLLASAFLLVKIGVLGSVLGVAIGELFFSFVLWLKVYYISKRISGSGLRSER